jgi:Tfp pilus assembly protein PilF
VRADDAAAVRSLQRTTNMMGEAGTYLAEGQYAWARATLERVLEIDPAHAEARALLAQLAELDPSPTALAALPPAGSAVEAHLVEGAGGG